MNKRGAYFFVIDAFIAVSIIIVSLVLIFSSQNTKLEKKPAIATLQGFLDFISDTKVREFNGEATRNMTLNGNITDIDNTLLDQIVEFYYTNKTGKNTDIITAEFLNEISTGMLYHSRSLKIYLQDKEGKVMLFNKSKSSYDESELMISLNKLAFKKINDTYVYGPVIFEVRLWV